MMKQNYKITAKDITRVLEAIKKLDERGINTLAEVLSTEINSNGDRPNSHLSLVKSGN